MVRQHSLIRREPVNYSAGMAKERVNEMAKRWEWRGNRLREGTDKADRTILKTEGGPPMTHDGWLIAAAPDLLDRLQAAQRFLFEQSNGARSGLLTSIETAIAKATGQEVTA